MAANNSYWRLVMAEINLDKTKTALMMADFATIGIGQNPIAQERHTLDRAQEVLNAARSAGIFVCYCISHFRPGFPEVSDRNATTKGYSMRPRCLNRS